MKLSREEVLRRFASLRQAPVRGGKRAPHKPLLLLFLLGRLQQRSRDDRSPLVVSYVDVDAVVSPLIAEFGPVSGHTHRAAMPFFHLGNDAGLWSLRGDGFEPKHAQLRDRAAQGTLDADVSETLQGDPALLAEVARSLIEGNFPQSYAAPLCEAVGLVLDEAPADGAKRVRSRDFRERVLRAYDECCAFCGFAAMAREGGVRLAPVGLAAAHVHWHALGGPDEASNGLALCDLHHTLFDRGLIGVSEARAVVVSGHFAPKDERSRALVSGLALRDPRAKDDAVSDRHFAWHREQVFRRAA